MLGNSNLCKCDLKQSRDSQIPKFSQPAKPYMVGWLKGGEGEKGMRRKWVRHRKCGRKGKWWKGGEEERGREREGRGRRRKGGEGGREGTVHPYGQILEKFDFSQTKIRKNI